MSFSPPHEAGVNFNIVLNSFAQALSLLFQDVLTAEHIQAGAAVRDHAVCK